MRTTLLILTLTMATALSFADEAFAQRGRGGIGSRGGYYAPSYYPYYSASPYYYGTGGYGPYYGRSNYAYRPYYYAAPYYGPDTTIYNYTTPQMQAYSSNPDTTQSQSYYYNPGATQQSVAIAVYVPTPDTRLWFDNAETKQQGMVRYFNSPPLDPGQTFTYTLKAHWMENGRPVERERQIKVQAGQQATVDFRGS